MKPQYIKIDEYGDKWYFSDKEMTVLHREDGPAREFTNGGKYWYKNGELHREDGPAIEWANGDKFWYLNGKCHREDGPAVEYADGYKEWCLNDKLHREDGPAREYVNGNKSWYLNDVELTEQQFKEKQSRKKTIDINGKSFTIEALNKLIESAK